MLVTICIGSSCHLKGSRDVITKFENMVIRHKVDKQVELTGSFCMGECAKGVCVKVDDELFSVIPADADTFFETEILGRIS